MSVNISCDDFMRDLSQLLDGELSAEAQARMYTHVAACPECAQALSESRQLLDMLAHIDDDIVVPAEFRAGWRNAVREIAAKTDTDLNADVPVVEPAYANVVPIAEARTKPDKRSGRFNGWTRALSGVAAAFVVLAGATAFTRVSNGATAQSVPQSTVAMRDATANAKISTDSTADAAAALGSAANEYYDSSGSNIEAMFNYTGSDSPTSSGLLDVEGTSSGASTGTYKVLRSAEMRVDSSEFETDIGAIKASVAKVGGLFERNATYGDSGARTAELVLRVPAGFLEMLVDDLQSIGHVTFSEVSALDISDQYTNTALKLDTLNAQYSRVQQLIAEAASLDDVLTLEQEASSLQYDIDALTGSLRGWDSHSEMSTVNITLTETVPIAAAAGISLGDKVSGAFQQSANWLADFGADMMITLGRVTPHLIWILPLGGIIALLVWLMRKRRPEQDTH